MSGLGPWDEHTPIVRACATCGQVLRAHGVPTRCPHVAWTAADMTAVASLIRAGGRGRLTARRRRAAEEYCRRLASIAEAGPEKSEIMAPALLCESCSAQLSEFRMDRGTVAFIGAPLARELLRFMDLGRGRLNEPDNARALELALLLCDTVGEVFERATKHWRRPSEGQSGERR
jgi:hypothetical protein